MKIHIFDVDGTLTRYGHDLWFLVMQQLCESEPFNTAVAKWQLTDKCYNASLQLLADTISLLHNSPDVATLIRRTACEFSCMLIRRNLVPAAAIATLRDSLQKADRVLLSTANYVESAHGFLDALNIQGMLNAEEREQLVILATEINWDSKEILRFNMAENKWLSYCGFLQQNNLPLIKPAKVYVDDPQNNDAAITQHAKELYIIDNPKNRDYKRPNNYRLYW